MAEFSVNLQIGNQTIEKYARLPEDIRASLRQEIPRLTKELARRVRAKLVPGQLFKTTTRLLPAVTVTMVENAHEIYGKVYIDPAKFPLVVSRTLESGSKPHEIVAKHSPFLYFYWEKLGKNVAFKRVHHPGFPGRSYMQSSLDEMQADIKSGLTDSVLRVIK